MFSCTVFLLFICIAAGNTVYADGVSASAVEGIIEGIPVPVGSILDGDSYYRDDDGVEMASYSHPDLSGKELLQFYDSCMQQWGWEKVDGGQQHRLQRSYSMDGVPVLIGVDKRKKGGSFNILKGVAGDWGYIPALRPESPAQ